jgi:hypothetical protein
MATAISASVTLSIAADRTGRRSSSDGCSEVATSTSRGQDRGGLRDEQDVVVAERLRALDASRTGWCGSRTAVGALFRTDAATETNP